MSPLFGASVKREFTVHIKVDLVCEILKYQMKHDFCIAYGLLLWLGPPTVLAPPEYLLIPPLLHMHSSAELSQCMKKGASKFSGIGGILLKNCWHTHLTNDTHVTGSC